MVPPRGQRQGSDDDSDSDGEHERRRAAASTVQYQETDEADEDEQLFIETIRRGALAVQQRRRRLLEGPRRRRAAEQEQERGMQGDEASNSTPEDDLLDTSVYVATSQPLRPLHATALLAAGSSSTSQTSLDRDTVVSQSAASSQSNMLLLYCDSSSGRPAVDFDASIGTSTPGRPSSIVADVVPLVEQTSSRLERGGGCGRLISVRGFASKLTPGEFESDAPPSHQLVDWLEIVSPKDDEVNWPHLCDCVQATLGCRSCGNAVGISTLFRCGPCRRSLGSSPSWTFWTSHAITRTAGVPLQAAWIGHVEAIDSGAAFLKGVDGNSTPAQLKPVGCLPTKEQDRLRGLVGDACDWQERAEALFNVTPLPTIQRDTKQRRESDLLRMLGNDTTPILRRITGMRGIDERSSSLGDGRILERARTLRRDLRAYLAQTGTNQTENASQGSIAGESVRTFEEGRRRRRSLLGLGEEREEESGGMPGSDEREFRRRRTAEILESGGVVGNTTDRQGVSEVVDASPTEELVGR